MTIHLAGETIDARTAHRLAKNGEIIQIVKGIYLDRASDDAELLSHAVRLAHYLYPRAYLSSISATLLGPTVDGRLFVSGRRNQRTRLRTLEIVQNEAPAHPSTVTAVVGDALGELRIEVSSPLQRFLEAFRLRSEHASAIAPDVRTQMAERLIVTYGTPRAAADALWALARENQWYREGEGAERYLLRGKQVAVAVHNTAAADYDVAWHGQPLGVLSFDGVEWRWSSSAAALPPLVRDSKPGRLPPFIESLMPEGWLEHVLAERDEREALRNGRRYLSNITITPQGEEPVGPADVLRGVLARYVDATGRFVGRYEGPSRGELEGSFEQNVARLYQQHQTPRLSGIQIKAPMSLLADGTLVPALATPFTHILKPAGTSAFVHLPTVEWLCLELGRAAGFVVPATALVPMPDGIPPALLVERFDIRRAPRERRLLALEDFCSLLELPAAAKYDSTIERAAKALRAASTEPEADVELLLRRAIFAWLIADGDMHLKNLAVLKLAQRGSRSFSSIRLAPLYDAVSTRVFPSLKGDRMALKLNGKDDRLSGPDFSATAKTIGLASDTAQRICSELATRLKARASTLQLPNVPHQPAGTLEVLASLLQIVNKRSASLLEHNA